MDEKKERLDGGYDGMLIATRVALAVAAVGLVIAFFLPWASADDAYREAAAQAPESTRNTIRAKASVGKVEGQLPA